MLAPMPSFESPSLNTSSSSSSSPSSVTKRSSASMRRPSPTSSSTSSSASSQASLSPNDGNWRLDVKFQGHTIPMVGRLPAEKRSMLQFFPRKLAISTKAKLSAIPARGFFCKFAVRHAFAEEMKVYMKNHECALCVTFVAATHNVTLYLAVPMSLRGLDCLHRLRKNGASQESIKSLCTDRAGVVIGFIVSEVNRELEEKRLEHEKLKQELMSTAETLSSTIGDSSLELDLLLDQLESKQTAIQICSRFIVHHRELHERVGRKLLDTMDAYTTAKAKLNVLFLLHDVLKNVRAHYPPEERNLKMHESTLVKSLEAVLYTVMDRIPREATHHSANVKAMLDLWNKWGLDYLTPHRTEEEDEPVDLQLAIMDESLERLSKDLHATSDASTSPVKPTASEEVLLFMKKHSIQPGPWEIYLSRASAQELEELDVVASFNEEYHKYNRWNSADKSGRRTGEYFLLHFVKLHMPTLLQARHPGHNSGSFGKRKRTKSDIELFRAAFLATWDVDSAAERAISDVERSVIDDMWKKMENEKCQNPSAFVFGRIRKMKIIRLALNPEVATLLARIGNESAISEMQLIEEMVRIFQLDSMAREGLEKLKTNKTELLKIAKELCERCRERMVANPSIHAVKLCHKALATTNPMKAYSQTMRTMLQRQMKQAMMFAQSSQKRRRLDGHSPTPSEADATSYGSAEDSITDAEIAAVKKRIPKPPKLLFKKVDIHNVTYTETNENGTVGVSKSGIPDAGRGLFNLSDHAWPAFSVVCIFGVRRITKEEHRDELTKVARCGELGETFVVVNGVVREVEKFQMQYGHRLQSFDGLVDAEGSVGGFPNDRVYEYPADVYWDASSFYNNCILVPGCLLDPQDDTSPICLNQLYIVTWKEVPVRSEFFLAYGTSYYEDSEKERQNQKKKGKAKATSTAS